MIDQAIRPEDVKSQMLVGVRPAFAVPFFTDNGRIAVGVE